jgi:hypothetical protein
VLVKTDSSQWELSRHAYGRSQMFPLKLAGTAKLKPWFVAIQQDQVELTDRAALTDFSRSASATENLAPDDEQPPQRRIG